MSPDSPTPQSKEPRHHFLKTEIDVWEAVAAGAKTAEFRKDDRGFQVGDTLVLLRGTARAMVPGSDAIERLVTHIVRGPDFGIPDGYALLSMRV